MGEFTNGLRYMWGHGVTWRMSIGRWDILIMDFWKKVVGLLEDSCVAFVDFIFVVWMTYMHF